MAAVFYKSVCGGLGGTVAGDAQQSPPLELITHVPQDCRAPARSVAMRPVLPLTVAAPVRAFPQACPRCNS